MGVAIWVEASRNGAGDECVRGRKTENADRCLVVNWINRGGVSGVPRSPASTQEFVDYTFALIPQRFHADSQYHFDQWWEALGPLFGHSFLHLGWWHVGGNVLFLFGASRWPSLRLGAWRYLVVYFAAVLAGAVLYLALNWNDPNASAVGASGGVCGMLTAFFFSTRRTWREALADPQVRGPLGGLFLVNVVLMGAASAAGVFPIAWEAHLGGFIGGGVAYALLQPRPAEDVA
ncbi:MAG: rhomboid family intramembrane serine protease [Caulobacteraceae bacterium]|nr:rhomboid family intramembrane serine protease [Caulobacteraceae bacterium]